MNQDVCVPVDSLVQRFGGGRWLCCHALHTKCYRPAWEQTPREGGLNLYNLAIRNLRAGGRARAVQNLNKVSGRNASCRKTPSLRRISETPRCTSSLASPRRRLGGCGGQI